MNRYAVIVAGGSGQRFGSPVPKQFQKLNDRPLLMHSIEKFARCRCEEIVVVIPESHHSFWSSLVRTHQFEIPHRVVFGGNTRCESVKNGLEKIIGDGIVAVHDAVRPLISTRLIESLFSSAESLGSAVPVIPLTDTVRKINGESSVTVDRNEYRLVQTPQCFRVSQLKSAFTIQTDFSFSDEASLMEQSGFPVFLAEGHPLNIKITRPEDLMFAQILFDKNLV